MSNSPSLVRQSHETGFKLSSNNFPVVAFDYIDKYSY